MTKKAIKIVPTLLLCLLCLQPVQASDNDSEQKMQMPNLSRESSASSTCFSDLSDNTQQIVAQNYSDALDLAKQAQKSQQETNEVIKNFAQKAAEFQDFAKANAPPPRALTLEEIDEEIKKAQFDVAWGRKKLNEYKAFDYIYDSYKYTVRTEDMGAVEIIGDFVLPGGLGQELSQELLSQKLSRDLSQVLSRDEVLSRREVLDRTLVNKQVRSRVSPMVNNQVLTYRQVYDQDIWLSHNRGLLLGHILDQAKKLKKIERNLTNRERKNLIEEVNADFIQTRRYFLSVTENLNNLYSARRIAYAKSLIPWNWTSPTISAIPSARNVKDVVKNAVIATKNVAVKTAVVVQKIAVNLGNKIPVAVKVVLGGGTLFALIVVAMKLIAKGGTPGAIGSAIFAVLTKASELLFGYFFVTKIPYLFNTMALIVLVVGVFHAFWQKTTTQQQVAVKEKNLSLTQKMLSKIFGKEASRVSSATENQKTDYSYLYLLLAFILLLLLAGIFGRKQK